MLGGMQRTTGRRPRLVVDDKERGIFRVHRSVYTDPNILALERERIFDRCWLYAGHESEVKDAGDFVTRRIAGRPSSSRAETTADSGYC